MAVCCKTAAKQRLPVVGAFLLVAVVRCVLSELFHLVRGSSSSLVVVSIHISYRFASRSNTVRTLVDTTSREQTMRGLLCDNTVSKPAMMRYTVSADTALRSRH